MKPFTKLLFKDDFMFCAVLHDNPQIARRIAEIGTRRKIKEIHNLQQQEWITTDPVLKQIRLDVTFEGDDTIYCIEMQVAKEKELAKRIRYYQSAKDAEEINAGADYANLRSTIILFICDYDPIGKGWQRYEITNRLEDGERFNDGRDIILLNTEGHQSAEEESLNALLQYIHSGEMNSDLLTQDIEAAVDRVKYNKEWRDRYMTIGEKINLAREEGIAQGTAAERINGIQKLIAYMQSTKVPDEQIKQNIQRIYDINDQEYYEILMKINPENHSS